MNWYYAVSNQRQGPVAEDAFRALIAAGTIQRDTLVWNSTFTEWRTAEAAGLFGTPSPTPPPPNTRVCIITGTPHPVSHMIETEHGWVSAEGRDIYYQCLRENVPFPNAGGGTNARADGKRVVVPAVDARLPLRCVKTNQPVTETQLKKKTLWWCPPLVLLSILLNILLMLILYLIFRKAVKLQIPLSKEGKRRVLKQGLLATAFCLGGVVMIFIGAANVDRGLSWLTILGLFVTLFGFIWAAWRAPILRVVKYKNGHAWLAGAHPDFVASLPRYVG